MNYEYFLMRNLALLALKLYFPQYGKRAGPAKGRRERRSWL